MRTRVLPVCVLLGVALAAFLGGATFGQRPTDLSSPDAENEPRRLDVATVPTIAPPQASPAPTSKGVQGLLGDDPLAAAEQYLEKTSQELSEAVNVLGKEAEALRARLERVEGAHRRLKGALDSLPPFHPVGLVPMPVPLERLRPDENR